MYREVYRIAVLAFSTVLDVTVCVFLYTHVLVTQDKELASGGVQRQPMDLKPFMNSTNQNALHSGGNAALGNSSSARGFSFRKI